MKVTRCRVALYPVTFTVIVEQSILW